MDEHIKAILDKHTTEITELFIKLREIIYSVAEPTETLWARLPSYCVGERFVRLIPFGDHINIEAVAVKDHTEELHGYKITPKGMLQIFVGQEAPTEILWEIFKETLG